MLRPMCYSYVCTFLIFASLRFPFWSCKVQAPWCDLLLGFGIRRGNDSEVLKDLSIHGLSPNANTVYL